MSAPTSGRTVAEIAAQLRVEAASMRKPEGDIVAELAEKLAEAAVACCPDATRCDCVGTCKKGFANSGAMFSEADLAVAVNLARKDEREKIAATVSVPEAMVERALKVLAFEHDGALFPDAYGDEEAEAERVTMRKVLAAALSQQPAALAVPAEPVAWQYRFATPDGLTWSDWQPIPSEAMARQTVDAFGKMGTRAEWRSLKVFEWGGYAGEFTEADFVTTAPEGRYSVGLVADGTGHCILLDGVECGGQWSGNDAETIVRALNAAMLAAAERKGAG